MQHSVINSLLLRENFARLADRIPTDMLGPDLASVFKTLRYAHEHSTSDVTVPELRELHYKLHPTMTDAKRDNLDDLFSSISAAYRYAPDMAYELLRLSHVKHTTNLLLGKVIELDSDPTKLESVAVDINDLVRSMSVGVLEPVGTEYESFDLNEIINSADVMGVFEPNLGPLTDVHSKLPRGVFVLFGARPEVGKTSFHAHLVAGPGGFARQGFNCHVLLNEEQAWRVRNRYATVATGLPIDKVREASPELLQHLSERVFLRDITGWTIDQLEQYVKDNPGMDVLVVDMLDKVKVPGDFAREDLVLGHLYSRFRDIVKQANVIGFGGSQLSADAEGKIQLSMDMLANSKTAKAAELDICYLIGKGMSQTGDIDPMRYLNIAKDKVYGLTGMRLPCMIDPHTGRYSK